MSDWSSLREQAERQSAAYERMLELNGGVGKLGVHNPDMFQDLLDWDDLSVNGHADTVLTLLDEIERLESEIAILEEALDGWENGS